MTYRTRMLSRIAALIAAAALAFIALGSASAQAADHPRHPAAHLRWEATQLHCKVTGVTEIPMGPVNHGVTCVTRAGHQRFNLLYYPRVLPAMHWWRTWTRGNCWVARDGFIVIVPAGDSRGGYDSGAYDYRWAGYAARHTDGFLRGV